MIKLAKLFLLVSAVLISGLLIYLIIHSFRDKNYFEFDEIVHYHTDLEELEIINIKRKENNTPSEKTLVNTVLYYHSGKIIDTAFVSKLEDAGYVRKEVGKEHFNALNDIFTDKDYTVFETTTCEPFYRDILVFKQQGRTTGIAKLCFKCQKYNIVGAKESIYGFGEGGDFAKLERVLLK